MKSRWKTKEKWIEYGLKKGYDERHFASFRKSKNKNERSWCYRGGRKRWTKEFPFEKRWEIRWKTRKEWIEHGLRYGYDKKNPSSFQKSKNKIERSWYDKAIWKRWLKYFKFTRLIENRWPTKEEWIEQGLKHAYNKRNPAYFQKSKNKIEKSWYYKGRQEGWYWDFNFNRLKTHYIRSEKNLQKFLEKNPDAKDIASLAGTKDYISDVADILIKLWPDRFVSAADLARSLPKAVKRIGHSLMPFSFDRAKKVKQKFSSNSEIIYVLDDLLFSIACDEYQTKFNENPKAALDEIRKYANSENGMKSLASRVLKHYQEIYSFDIPGYGKLDEF